jgi:hypothetical protein
LIVFPPRVCRYVAGQHNGFCAVDPRADAVRLRLKRYHDDRDNKGRLQIIAHKSGMLNIGWTI